MNHTDPQIYRHGVSSGNRERQKIAQVAVFLTEAYLLLSYSFLRRKICGENTEGFLFPGSGDLWIPVGTCLLAGTQAPQVLGAAK